MRGDLLERGGIIRGKRVYMRGSLLEDRKMGHLRWMPTRIVILVGILS
jgi:hypothetical protein